MERLLLPPATRQRLKVVLLATSQHKLASPDRSSTELCKNVHARFREWLDEILRHSAVLGRVADHFENDSRNLAGMFLHFSVLVFSARRHAHFGPFVAVALRRGGINADRSGGFSFGGGMVASSNVTPSHVEGARR